MKETKQIRNTKSRVKTAKGRKLSSTLWLNRQINDPYVKMAARDGYRSRAAYKLLEVNEKTGFLKPGLTVIDLGAAPGSWSQVCHNQHLKRIIAIDIQPIKPLKDLEFIKGDFMNIEIQSRIRKLADKVDIILSDMSPPATGHNETDHLQIMNLAEEVIEFSKVILRKNGALLIKLFQGGSEKQFQNQLRTLFSNVKFIKPKASRDNSREIYIYASGYLN